LTKQEFWEDVEVQHVDTIITHIEDYIKALYDIDTSGNFTLLVPGKDDIMGMDVSKKVWDLLSLKTSIYEDLFVSHSRYYAPENVTSENTITTELKEALKVFKEYEKRFLLNYLQMIQCHIIQQQMHIDEIDGGLQMANYYNNDYRYFLNSLKQLLFVLNTNTIYSTKKIQKGYRTVMSDINATDIANLVKFIFGADTGAIGDSTKTLVQTACGLLKGGVKTAFESGDTWVHTDDKVYTVKTDSNGPIFDASGYSFEYTDPSGGTPTVIKVPAPNALLDTNLVIRLNLKITESEKTDLKDNTVYLIFKFVQVASSSTSNMLTHVHEIQRDMIRSKNVIKFEDLRSV
jgi:hypothetical protein